MVDDEVEVLHDTVVLAGYDDRQVRKPRRLTPLEPENADHLCALFLRITNCVYYVRRVAAGGDRDEKVTGTN